MTQPPSARAAWQAKNNALGGLGPQMQRQVSKGIPPLAPTTSDESGRMTKVGAAQHGAQQAVLIQKPLVLQYWVCGSHGMEHPASIDTM
jgi:hypothetical protein